ncbi:MAG TPA: YdeI/OmpD-associated family protein [Candidatus Acidoferrales bacterium]|nr:YdeI/OmpD-associated family protein [Candidatus Acidoferrales bacterium]
MELHKNIPVYVFLTVNEWEEWLASNHDSVQAIWMKVAKKNGGATSISYDEALIGALSYGWIDGLINRYDEQYYLTRFTPRGEKSVWSKRNQQIVEKLTTEGKMQPPGLGIVNKAKANGRWHVSYDSPKEMEVPEDFLKELAKDKKAEEFFRSLNRANTYAIAWRLQTAKKPETRKKRMEILLGMMKKGEKLH